MVRASENIIKWFGQDNSTKRDLSLLVQASIAESGTAIKEDDLFVPLDVNEDGSIDENFEHFYIGRGIAAQYFSKKALALRTENGEVKSPTNQAILKEVGVLSQDTENPQEVKVAPNYSVRIGNEEGKAVVETKTENGTEVSVSPQIEAGTVINPQSVAAAKETPKPLPAVTYAPKVEPTPETDEANTSRNTNPPTNPNNSNVRIPSSNPNNQRQVVSPTDTVAPKNPDTQNTTKDEIEKKIGELGVKINVTWQEVDKETSIAGKKNKIKELRDLITEFEKYINDNSANIDTEKKTDLRNGINNLKKELEALENNINKLANSSDKVIKLLEDGIKDTEKIIKSNETNSLNPFDYLASWTSGNGRLNEPLKELIKKIEDIKAKLKDNRIDVAQALKEYNTALGKSTENAEKLAKEVSDSAIVGARVTTAVIALSVIASGGTAAAIAVPGLTVVAGGAVATTAIAGTVWAPIATTGLTLAGAAGIGGTTSVAVNTATRSVSYTPIYNDQSRSTYKEIFKKEAGVTWENTGDAFRDGFFAGAMGGGNVLAATRLVKAGFSATNAAAITGTGSGIIQSIPTIVDPNISWDRKLMTTGLTIAGNTWAGWAGAKFPIEGTLKQQLFNFASQGVSQATFDILIAYANDGTITPEEIPQIISGILSSGVSGNQAHQQQNNKYWGKPVHELKATKADLEAKIKFLKKDKNKKNERDELIIELVKVKEALPPSYINEVVEKFVGNKKKPPELSPEEIKARLDNIDNSNQYKEVPKEELQAIKEEIETELAKDDIRPNIRTQLEKQLSLVKEVLAAHGITDTPPPRIPVPPTESEQQLQQDLEALANNGNIFTNEKTETILHNKGLLEAELLKPDIHPDERTRLENEIRQMQEVLDAYERNTQKPKGRLEASLDKAKEAGAKFQEWNKERQLAAIKKKHGDKYIKMSEEELLTNREAQKLILDNPALNSTDKVAARKELEIIDKVMAARGIKVPSRGIIDKFISPSLEKLAAWSDNQRWLQSALGSRPALIVGRSVGWVWNKATGLASPVTKRVSNFVELNRYPESKIEQNPFLHYDKARLKIEETATISDLRKAKYDIVRETYQEDIRLIRQAQRYQETRENLDTILELSSKTDPDSTHALEAEITKFKANQDEVVKKKAIEDKIEHLEGNISQLTIGEATLTGQKIDLLESLLAEPQKISNETPAAQTRFAKVRRGLRNTLESLETKGRDLISKAKGGTKLVTKKVNIGEIDEIRVSDNVNYKFDADAELQMANIYLGKQNQQLQIHRERIYLDHSIVTTGENGLQVKYNVYNSNKQLIAPDTTRSHSLNREQTYYSRPIDEPNTIYQIKIGKKDIEITKLTPAEVKEFVAAPKPADSPLPIYDKNSSNPYMTSGTFPRPFKSKLEYLQSQRAVLEQTIKSTTDPQALKYLEESLAQINEAIARHENPGANPPPPKTKFRDDNLTLNKLNSASEFYTTYKAELNNEQTLKNIEELQKAYAISDSAQRSLAEQDLEIKGITIEKIETKLTEDAKKIFIEPLDILLEKLQSSLGKDFIWTTESTFKQTKKNIETSIKYKTWKTAQTQKENLLINFLTIRTYTKTLANKLKALGVPEGFANRCCRDLDSLDKLANALENPEKYVKDIASKLILKGKKDTYTSMDSPLPKVFSSINNTNKENDFKTAYGEAITKLLDQKEYTKALMLFEFVSDTNRLFEMKNIDQADKVTFYSKFVDVLQDKFKNVDNLKPEDLTKTELGRIFNTIEKEINSSKTQQTSKEEPIRSLDLDTLKQSITSLRLQWFPKTLDQQNNRSRTALVSSLNELDDILKNGFTKDKGGVSVSIHMPGKTEKEIVFINTPEGFTQWVGQKHKEITDWISQNKTELVEKSPEQIQKETDSANFVQSHEQVFSDFGINLSQFMNNGVLDKTKLKKELSAQLESKKWDLINSKNIPPEALQFIDADSGYKNLKQVYEGLVEIVDKGTTSKSTTLETIDSSQPKTKTQTIDFNHGGIREVKIQEGIQQNIRVDGEWKDINVDSFGPIGIRSNGEIIIENNAGLSRSAIITDQNGNYLPPVGGTNYGLKKNAIYYVQNSSNEYFEVKIGSDNIEINRTDASKIPARNNNALTFDVGEYKTQVDNQINLRIDGGDIYKEFSLGLLDKGVLVQKDGTIKFIDSNKSQDSKIFFSDGTELPIDTPIETGKTYYIQSNANPNEKYKVERNGKEVTISRSTDDLQAPKAKVDLPQLKTNELVNLTKSTDVANPIWHKVQDTDLEVQWADGKITLRSVGAEIGFTRVGDSAFVFDIEGKGISTLQPEAKLPSIELQQNLAGGIRITKSNRHEVQYVLLANVETGQFIIRKGYHIDNIRDLFNIYNSSQPPKP